MAGVIFDSAGNIFGTTQAGGMDTTCCGTVFELSKTQSEWTENVVYSFSFGTGDGVEPEAGLISDGDGNLYGTTVGGGGIGNGTVFMLSQKCDSWTESILYSFGSHDDGGGPKAGLLLDGEGNLYGTTSGGGGTFDFGTVFELTPNGGGGWNESILYGFRGGNDGAQPVANVVMDTAGNLYGTTFAGGSPQGCFGDGCGTVFKLTPQGGKWIETQFRFPESGKLGYMPTTPVTLSSDNEVYGTTSGGGTNSEGVTFKITQ